MEEEEEEDEDFSKRNCHSQVQRKRKYRQPGWIGTDRVNRDTGLEPGDTLRQNVSPGSPQRPDSPC